MALPRGQEDVPDHRPSVEGVTVVGFWVVVIVAWGCWILAGIAKRM